MKAYFVLNIISVGNSIDKMQLNRCENSLFLGVSTWLYTRLNIMDRELKMATHA